MLSFFEVSNFFTSKAGSVGKPKADSSKLPFNNTNYFKPVCFGDDPFYGDKSNLLDNGRCEEKKKVGPTCSL
jgi:hypothetical protein